MEPVGTRVVFLLLIGVLAGCESTPPPPVYPSDLPPSEAARIVLKRLAGVESFSAEIDLTLEREGSSRSASGALVVSRPDRIRLRCWGPLGIKVLDLLVVDRIADLTLPREDRTIELDLDDRNLDSAKLEPEVRALLLIDAVSEDLNAHRMRWRLDRPPAADRGAILFFAGGRPVSRLEYDRATLLPTRRERLEGAPLTITYGDYLPAGEIWWPRELEIESPEFRVTVKIDDITLNPELDPRVFVPVRPIDEEEE